MKNRRSQLAVKRILDVILGSVLLVFITPLLLIVSIIVKTTSRGPALYVQKRPGLNGEPFRILKIRTMYQGSERMQKGIEVSKNDSRVTPVGKFLRRTKIDELPQLINVIKGEMSLVGPRPERMSSIDSYSEETRKRLKMRPGMTGLAQVNGNIYIALEERYILDVRYVENFTLLLDIYIIIRTIAVVVLGEKCFHRKANT